MLTPVYPPSTAQSFVSGLSQSAFNQLVTLLATRDGEEALSVCAAMRAAQEEKENER